MTLHEAIRTRQKPMKKIRPISFISKVSNQPGPPENPVPKPPPDLPGQPSPTIPPVEEPVTPKPEPGDPKPPLPKG